MPRLKIKDEIRYRKGSTNESQNCRACEHFKRDFYEFHKQTGTVVEHRCAIIGLAQSIRYRVRADYTCDRQEMGDHYRDYLDKLSGRAK